MAKAFPFFRLPRELRDLIYFEIGGRAVSFKLVIPADSGEAGDEAQDESKIYTAYMPFAPRLEVVMVSREFKHEYENEIRPYMSLGLLAETEDKSLDKLNLKTDSKLRAHLPQITKLKAVVLPLVDSPYSRWPLPDGVSILERSALVHTISPHLSSLKEMVDHMHTPMMIPDEAEGFEALKTSYRNLLSTMGVELDSGQKVGYHVELFFHHDLYTMAPAYQATQAEQEEFPILLGSVPWDITRQFMQSHSNNVIVYQATTSSDEDALFGLDLKVVKASSFDFLELARAGQVLIDNVIETDDEGEDEEAQGEEDENADETEEESNDGEEDSESEGLDSGAEGEDLQDEESDSSGKH